MKAISMTQSGGVLYQQSSGGGVSKLDVAGSGVAPTVINITVPGAKEFFEKETVRVVVQNPRTVQGAVLDALRGNAGRRQMAALQLSPGTLLA
jgi:hypothetical protein